MIPTLDGVHHLKLPVTDLDRSIAWYRSRLGYQVVIVFRSHGVRTGVTMAHPDGGPTLGLVQDPEQAIRAAGFDYFSIGVPDRAGLVALADHLTGMGEHHAGVHFATVGWILPLLHDPDGHEIRFYTTEAHTDLDPAHPLEVDDAIASAQAAELAWLAARRLPAVPDGSVPPQRQRAMTTGPMPRPDGALGRAEKALSPATAGEARGTPTAASCGCSSAPTISGQTLTGARTGRPTHLPRPVQLGRGARHPALKPITANGRS